ncbi:hypothetical protein PILCRDRAFT_10817 [Piloderma croceum F 1598]|uniref:Uncharacterized protein n=1 Tax=Piloderma croceum (strain F 1598) TaxID=765440 RepID=A0A0C3F266_PILCF|nr:hypothetical protein PILCRDRAFT_10817 [Piloderma croceum F 1598]
MSEIFGRQFVDRLSTVYPNPDSLSSNNRKRKKKLVLKFALRSLYLRDVDENLVE